jgi:hypothetical protein
VQAPPPAGAHPVVRHLASAPGLDDLGEGDKAVSGGGHGRDSGIEAVHRLPLSIWRRLVARRATKQRNFGSGEAVD